MNLEHEKSNYEGSSSPHRAWFVICFLTAETTINKGII